MQYCGIEIVNNSNILQLIQHFGISVLLNFKKNKEIVSILKRKMMLLTSPFYVKICKVFLTMCYQLAGKFSFSIA